MHTNTKKSADFLTDAAKGALPNVSWGFGPSHADFHPGPGNSMSGSDAWLAKAVEAVATGSQWGECMIFITFDDWGGWTDHVTPPNVEQSPAGTTYAGDQYRYGSRVPCVVVGPYAKPKHVSSALGSHTSMVAFVERLWKLQPSASADARRRTAADLALADTYDLSQTPNAKPALPGGAAPAEAMASDHGVLVTP
jgi:phospholipase C